MVTPVAMEPLLGYHPCSIGFLTSRRDPAVGQCQTGSLIRRPPPKGHRRRPEGSPEWTETIRRVQRQKELTGDTDGWSRYESRA